MIGEKLQQYTYEYLMSLALSFVPDDRDKREGSVIYDALAPFCQVLSAGAIELKNFYSQTYALTASGEYLDTRVAEQGIHRHVATYAVKKVVLKDSEGKPVFVPLGTRFSTVSSTQPVNYKITAQYTEDGVSVPGAYEATCEEVGTIGNQYFGDLVNITFVQGLASAYMAATLVPARDNETDEELRDRYLEVLNQPAFGGNIADYKAKVAEISGVGAVQVYPVWDGGGTVKLSIIDPAYNRCSDEFLSAVQNAVDPENSQGVKGTGMGIAPIGHKVTVVTPDEAPVSITATVTLQAGYYLDHVKEPVQNALADYFLSLRRAWADAGELNIYNCDVFVSRVYAVILSVPGVVNVSNVQINGKASDLQLVQNGQIQQLPTLSEVTLNV